MSTRLDRPNRSEGEREEMWRSLEIVESRTVYWRTCDQLLRNVKPEVALDTTATLWRIRLRMNEQSRKTVEENSRGKQSRKTVEENSRVKESRNDEKRKRHLHAICRWGLSGASGLIHIAKKQRSKRPKLWFRVRPKNVWHSCSSQQLFGLCVGSLSFFIRSLSFFALSLLLMSRFPPILYIRSLVLFICLFPSLLFVLFSPVALIVSRTLAKWR